MVGLGFVGLNRWVSLEEVLGFQAFGYMSCVKVLVAKSVSIIGVIKDNDNQLTF